MDILGYLFLGIIVFLAIFLFGVYMGMYLTVWVLKEKKNEGTLHEWFEENMK